MRKTIKVRDANGNEQIKTADVIHIPSGESGDTSRVPFHCIEDSTILSSDDLRLGVIGYKASGERVEGTNDGGGGGGGDREGYPIETDDAAVMSRAKTAENEGRIYKWTGSTGTAGYAHDELYIVHDDSNTVR